MIWDWLRNLLKFATSSDEGQPLTIEWLSAPIVCNGSVVRPGLSLVALTDVSLSEICLRMQLIQDSIEYERCEGRLINLEIFDSIDTLSAEIKQPTKPRLSDWLEFIGIFGEYYGLARDPIVVSPRAYEDVNVYRRWMGLEPELKG